MGTDRDAPPALPGIRILSRLGQGGMGTVWKGLDERLGREVAVKALAPRLAADGAYVARFQREARYLARLRHENLVTVYDVSRGSLGKAPCLVMEYVAGETLARRLSRQGRLSWTEARGLLLQLLAGLEAVHQAGLVHRDLKPGNVLVDEKGRVKVMDFGLAKDAAEAALTQEGMILGTPEYMSPEQARGDAVSPASDVYAVGVIAWEALSGRTPFRADSTVATLRMQCQDPVPPLPEGLPLEAQGWILRALEKDPARRFRDAGEMHQALASGAPPVRAASPPLATPLSQAAPLPQAVPVRHRGRRARFWAAAGVALAAAASSFLLLRPAPQPSVRLLLERTPFEGRLVGIRTDPAGGHVVVIVSKDGERAFRIAVGQEASLEFPEE